jgi:hypothetical protein
VFLLNSCLGLFTAAYLRRHPFLRTYGVNLPSSLTTLLPIVLGFSPHLPVSVCGTGTYYLDSGFSRQCDFNFFGTYFPYASRPQITLRTLLHGYILRLHGLFLLSAKSILLCPRFSFYDNRWYRIFYLLSIGYAFRPRLRSRLTLGGRTFPRNP